MPDGFDQLPRLRQFASPIGASPKHIRLPSFIEVACQDKQQVREPIGVFQGGRVDRLLIGDFGHVSLGPAYVPDAEFEEAVEAGEPALISDLTARGTNTQII
jgi:hypothetical protein